MDIQQPFVWIEQNNIQKILEYLKKDFDPNIKDQKGDTLLHKAIFKNNNELVKMFLKYGANVNAKNKKGETPLHIAVRFNRLEFIKLLIEKGAIPDEKDKNGNTPFHLVLEWMCSMDCIYILLDCGADPRILNKYGVSVIKLMEMHGYWDVASMLENYVWQEIKEPDVL